MRPQAAKYNESMKILTLWSLFFFSISVSQAQITRPWFKVVPEHEAHSSWGQARDLELDPQSIKCLVWNIKKTEMSPWNIEYMIYGFDKNLHLIQEAFRNERFNSTLNLFQNMRWDMSTSMLYRKQKNTPTGTMIGSTAEAVEAWASHSPDTEIVVQTPKANIFTKYRLKDTNQTLLVISIHGINITSFGAFKRHLNQIQDEILSHEGPVIYAGDFNTRTASRTNYMNRQLAAIGMKEVKFINGEHRMKWPVLKDTYLDHAFVRGLDVAYAEVLKNSNGSDHKPMVMTLKLSASNESQLALLAPHN